MDEVEKLIEELKDVIRAGKETGNYFTAHAEFKFAKIGEPAVEPLLGLLADERNRIARKCVIDALVIMGMPAVKPLVEASKKPEYGHLKREISEILERIDKKAKWNRQDFGCVEKVELAKPKIPDEFRKAVLDKTPAKVSM